MSTDIAKLIPVQSVENGIIVAGNGDLTIGFSMILPEVFTLTGEKASDIVNSLTGIFKQLPPGTIIHKQDVFYNDSYKSEFTGKDNYTKKENNRYYNGKAIQKHYSNLFITFSQKKKPINSLKTLPDYIFNKPFKNIEKMAVEIEKHAVNIENSLKTIREISVARMNDDQLLDNLYRYYNQQLDVNTHYDDDYLQPISISDDAILIGDRHVNIISLVQEGSGLELIKKPRVAPAEVFGTGVEMPLETVLKTSFVYPLGIGLPIDHILNTIIEIQDQESMLAGLSMEKRKLNFTASLGYSPAIEKQKNIQNFVDALNVENFTPAKTAINVVLSERSKESLQKNAAIVKNAFANLNSAKGWLENYDTARLFYDSSPGYTRANNRKFIHTLEQAVYYMNLETHYYSDDNGVLFVDRYGKPLFIDLWNSEDIVNKNSVIFGPSGSGKSFFNNHIIDQLLAQGNHVVIIDIGHSYEKSVELNGGRYIDSRNKKSLAFNIFLTEKDTKGNYIYRQSDDDGEGADDLINFISSVIQTIWKEGKVLQGETKTILKDIIIAYYKNLNEKKAFPDMIGFYEFIPYYREKLFDRKKERFFDFDSLLLMLEPYVNGDQKYLLNAKENIDIKEDKFVVFDMEDISGKGNVFNVVALVFIELVINKIKRLPGVRKNFIIDEALDFLKSDVGEFIAYLYRTFRKKNGSVSIAAQNVSFLKSASWEIQDSIKINSDTKILLNHSNYKSTYKELQELLSLTDHDIELLDSIRDGKGYREFFIKMGNHSRILRNQVCRKTALAYSTTPEEKSKLEELFQKNGDMVSAIETYIEQENK